MYVKVRGYRGQGLGSPIIKWFTRSEFSHVSLVFDTGGGRVEEVEAIQRKGVIAHPPHTEGKMSFVEYEVPLNFEQIMEAHELALSLVGARYDWKAIRSFVAHRKKHSLDKWQCAELASYVLWKVAYPLSRRKPFMENPASVLQSLQLLEAVSEEGAA